jgi:hypothetical protein
MTPMAPRKNLNDGSGIPALPVLLDFVMGSERLGETICSEKGSYAESFDRSPNMLPGR